jgi:hypothetical protein
MQKNSMLTPKTVAQTGPRAWSGKSEFSVVQSVWFGGFRAICLILGLTIGWIVLVDPAVLHDLSFFRATPHAGPHL